MTNRKNCNKSIEKHNKCRFQSPDLNRSPVGDTGPTCKTALIQISLCDQSHMKRLRKPRYEMIFFLINLSSRVRVQWLVWLNGGRWCAHAAARNSQWRWSWWPPRCWSTVRPLCWPALICHWVSLNYGTIWGNTSPTVELNTLMWIEMYTSQNLSETFIFWNPSKDKKNNFVHLKCRPQVRICVYLPVCVCVCVRSVHYTFSVEESVHAAAGWRPGSPRFSLWLHL